MRERQKGRVGKFSGGMKRRLNFGIALLHNVAILLVVISTTGFTAAMGLLISTLAKISEQVVVLTLFPIFVLSGLGSA